MDVKPFDVERFTRATPEMSEFVKSLANPVRLRILCLLSGGECSVGALSEAVGVSMATISQHLALLRKDRLVSCRRANQMVFYALADEKVARLINGLAEQFCKADLKGKAGASPDPSTSSGETDDSDRAAQKGL